MSDKKLEPGTVTIGTRVRSLNWAKPYGHIIGWEPTLGMNLIRWDGTADHGREAREPQEFEIIGPTEDELRLLRTIKELDESIAVEQALDSMHRKGK